MGSECGFCIESIKILVKNIQIQYCNQNNKNFQNGRLNINNNS